MVIVAVGAFAASMLLTGAVRKLALAYGVLDIPNARSSHAVPTPRGGGAAIVLAATAGFIALYLLEAIDIALLAALSGGGVAVAAVGFLDDRGRLSPGIRLAVHVGAAAWALACLGGLPPLRIGDHVVSLGWEGLVLAALGIVWTINLFNFMDGIDGIAASQAVFMASSAVFLTLVAGASSGGSAALVFGAACAGFLLWNWPPARIFMGDVGSGYVGYVIAILALADMHDSPISLWIWLTLGGIFIVDTTVTLARRLARRERVFEGHRSHAYQGLARRWGNHRRVTIAVGTVNLAWLLPCALLATNQPRYAAWISIGALTPLVVLAIVAGAGRRQDRARP